MSTWLRDGCGWWLAYLVDLPPFLRRLFCEALVDHRHDLVQQLTANVSDSTQGHVNIAY